jgi:hypothetical protein
LRSLSVKKVSIVGDIRIYLFRGGSGKVGSRRVSLIGVHPGEGYLPNRQQPLALGRGTARRLQGSRAFVGGWYA